MKKIITFLILLMFSSSAMAGWTKGEKKNITIDSITSSESLPINCGYYSPLKTDVVSAGVVTVDFDDSNNHRIILPNNGTTINLVNFKSGCKCTIYLKQPSSGAAGTVTFSPTLKWDSGIPPVLTTTNSALDIVHIDYTTEDGYSADIELDKR